MTINQLLRTALRKLGVADLISDSSPEEYANALESANAMLKSWSSRGLITYHIVKENFPLVVGQAAYTIGTSGNFNTSRPNELVGAFLRDANGTDYPLTIIDRDKYNRIPIKTISARPEELYYYPTAPLAVIYTNTEPDQVYTLYLDSLKPLAELVLDDTFTLPPEYEEALVYNLALRLSSEYQVRPSDVVAMIAQESLRNLTIQPVPESNLCGIPGNQSSRYNIYTGE